MIPARAQAQEPLRGVPSLLNMHSLRGLRRLPRRSPEMVGLGDKGEAVSYAAAAKVIWQGTPGALDRLIQVQQAL